MTTNRDFDRIAGAWLAEGPSELADRVLDAAFDEIHLTAQRRRWSAPWRTPTMNPRLRLVAAIAVIAIVGYTGLTLLGPRLGPGEQPTAQPTVSPAAVASPAPTPSPAPTVVPLDTSSWVLFGSAHNWLGILFPREWVEVAADHDWTLPKDAAWPNTAADRFTSPDGQIVVAAWSVPIEPGTTLEDWIAEYCPLNTTPCTGIAQRAVPIFTEREKQNQGLLVPFDGNAQAFFLHGERIWVVAVWRGESDPSVAPYGGARRLLQAFAESMCFDCSSPIGATPLP